MTISTANVDAGSDSPRLARAQIKEAIDSINNLDDNHHPLQAYAELRMYQGSASGVRITGVLASAQPQGIAGQFIKDTTDTTSGALFTGSISGTTLTVSAVTNGTLAIGQAVNRGDTGATVGYITAGSGLSWTLSASATVASMTMTADNGGTYLVAANGVRWKRDYKGDLHSGWFNPVGDKVADDFWPLQVGTTASAGRTFVIDKPTTGYKISQRIEMQSATTVKGAEKTIEIFLNVATIDGFYATGKSNCIVRDLKITQTAVSAVGYIGGVTFYNCDYCKIKNVEMVGMTWAGALLWDSRKSKVEDCTFSAFLGTGGDKTDIAIYGNSNYNTVRDNHCYGGGDHGIIVFDPYVNATPTGNKIIDNYVGEHTAYGILAYVTTQYDTKTLISGNHVFDILGSAGVGGFGAGIHVQSAGGTIVSDNVVWNCCRSTSNFETLGMAAITIAVGEYAGTAAKGVVCSNNQIRAERGPGIYVLASNASVLVQGNTIKSTGTTAVRGEAIIVSDAKAAKVINNDVEHVNTNYYAVRVTAGTAEYARGVLAKNTIKTSGVGGIIVNYVSGAGKTTNLEIEGNDVEVTGGGTAYFLQKSDNLRFVANRGLSDGPVLVVTDCLNARYTGGNQLKSTYAAGVAIQFTGTNTGSVWDESNKLDLAVGGTIDNVAANGTIFSCYGTTAPFFTGNHAVGDEVINTVPATGAPERWRCITAGNPGTWRAIGVISGIATSGDAAATLTPYTSKPTLIVNAALTADRAITLSTTGALEGAKFRVVRNASATGAFNLNVGTGPLKALAAASTWCDVEYDGSAWVLVAYGTL